MPPTEGRENATSASINHGGVYQGSMPTPSGGRGAAESSNADGLRVRMQVDDDRPPTDLQPVPDDGGAGSRSSNTQPLVRVVVEDFAESVIDNSELRRTGRRCSGR